MRFVIARSKDDALASEITKKVDVLQAIEWIAKAWGEVSVDTIKNCFKKRASPRPPRFLNTWPTNIL